MSKKTTAGLSEKDRPDPTAQRGQPKFVNTNPVYDARPFNDLQPNNMVRAGEGREVGGVAYAQKDLPQEVKNGFVVVEKNLRRGTYTEIDEEKTPSRGWKPKGSA